MSWWFDDTGRNARRQSCEEVGERRKTGEEGKGGEERKGGEEGKGGEERKREKGGRGGEGERKTEWMQGVGRMGREKKNERTEVDPARI